MISHRTHVERGGGQIQPAWPWGHVNWWWGRLACRRSSRGASGRFHLIPPEKFFVDCFIVEDSLSRQCHDKGLAYSCNPARSSGLSVNLTKSSWRLTRTCNALRQLHIFSCLPYKHEAVTSHQKLWNCSAGKWPNDLSSETFDKCSHKTGMSFSPIRSLPLLVL